MLARLRCHPIHLLFGRSTVDFLYRADTWGRLIYGNLEWGPRWYLLLCWFIVGAGKLLDPGSDAVLRLREGGLSF